jgi:hypothetical protein
MSKIAIFFSDNCEDIVRDFVKQILGINNEVLGEKYLGFPTAIGRS